MGGPLPSALPVLPIPSYASCTIFYYYFYYLNNDVIVMCAIVFGKVYKVRLLKTCALNVMYVCILLILGLTLVRIIIHYVV